MADDKREPRAVERPDATPAKGKPHVMPAGDLKQLAETQRPRGIVGKIRAENPRATRPGALPMPHRTNISAFSPAPVIDRWNSDAAGIRAVEHGDNVITMFGPIGEDFWTGEGVTAKRVTAQLRTIGARPVEVQINSFGGDMFEGIAIYNVLREHPQEVTIKVMGMAASAASIIAMAGDRIAIGVASFIMIHNCWVMAAGNQYDFAEMAEFLAPFDSAMADVYAQRTGIEPAEIAKMMRDDTYMSGTVAIDKGFADELLSSEKMKVDETTKASDTKLNDLRAMELQLVATGMTRADARARIKKITGTPGAASEGGTPGAASATDDVRPAEPKAGDLQPANLVAALLAFRS